MLRQRTYTPITPFHFTGKEKDPETGYSYLPHQARQAHHGVKCLEHDLMTGWLSVDPMADKCPSIIPYAYFAWIPAKLVNPDGREVYVIGDGTDFVVERL